jgi:carboxypeptidase Q
MRLLGTTTLFFTLAAISTLPADARAQGMGTSTNGSIVEDYQEAADRLIDAALADSAAYARLTEMVDRFGHRFSGSKNLEQALD